MKDKYIVDCAIGTELAIRIPIPDESRSYGDTWIYFQGDVSDC